MSPCIAERLRAAAADLPDAPVTMAGLLQAHGPAAQGSLLLLLAVPCMLPLPGTGTVFGLGLLAFAWALWRGRREALLPDRVARLELSCASARKVLDTLAWLYARAGGLARARWAGVLHGASERVVAACVAAMAVVAGMAVAMAVVLVLPIPLGNLLPAVALMVLGVGLVFRDGLAVLAGLGLSVLTAGGLLALVVWGADWLAQGLA